MACLSDTWTFIKLLMHTNLYLGLDKVMLIRAKDKKSILSYSSNNIFQ